ncbi:peptidoglycan/LPS O-acetylase OafA/YrhL [Gelidibacter sediminis]|uniref:Peptidoglycan/LPS O-acetylase OafA/YrhL n=1 Tax=Gelidibacter sediminis TaxID=1608710 RepID=A0A4R7PJ77_9FLAO|nr:acyltransferase [Gelidibacter sediminis]TDU34453.1 peptidoglycan/LPS O-acetylase OafA/YrhL [Gelidibacter sediminis]
MQKERNFGLDLLRAIAITLVVVSHLTYVFVQESDHPIILMIRTLGAVGVDLFFVLSGFLIGGILLKGIENDRTRFPDLITFWKRRWWRTLPNYFLMLLVNIAIYHLFTKELPIDIGSFFVFTQNFAHPQSEFFTESWSLSIEEYAYLVLPLLMFCVLAVFRTNGKLVFLYTTLSVVFVAFLLKYQFYLNTEILTYKNWSGMFRKVVIYRLDSIYFGFLLVYVMRQKMDFFKRHKFKALVLGGLTFLAVHLSIFMLNLQPELHPGFFVFLYLPLISLSCALAFPFAVHMKRSAGFNPLVYFVSTRSYAIYLVNFSAILLCIHYLIDLETAALALKLVLSVVYLGMTIGISNLIYNYFEKPILDYRDRNIR